MDQHDLRLVAVAALICATACIAMLGFQLRALQARGLAARRAWMALTGLVAGSGVWSTHFIAMLAYQPKLAIGYDIAETVASLATAVVGMGIGFALPVTQRGWQGTLAGGLIAGLSVGAMHYMGIAAIRAPAHIEWDYAFVVASIVIGMVGATAALHLQAILKRRARWMAPPVLLLLGIVGLHFTGMTAVRLAPDPALRLPDVMIGRDVLALATALLAGVILAAASCLMWMEGQGRRATLHGLREALDVVPTALAFYDPGGRLVSWNQAYASLMAECGSPPAEGMARAAAVEAALRAGWRAADGSDHLQRRRDVTAGAMSSAVDLITPDGRWLRHEAFATHDDGGVTVLTDVTEQQETARVLAEARDAAEAANRAKSQFLANISHEIRTPLNGVLGVADMLSESKLDPRQRELVGVIQSSGGLLNVLLGNLLDLARAEAGAAELKPQAQSLLELVDSVRRDYAPAAAEKGLDLHLDLGPGAEGQVSCDGVRLRQVIGSLVSNAVKFTDVGEVSIAVQRQGEAVIFQVTDSGVGFDAATKAQLFGRFEQADDSATRRHGGAGLGLAIAERYVRLMGGELDCDSRPGEGARFWFTLALPALAPPQAAPHPKPVAQGAAPDDRFRVLVVDDNAVNRRVLTLVLDSVGIAHAEVENGRDGVEAVMTGGFDVVLMDIQMPVMDGLEATRRIRAWEAETGRSRLPILIVSANGLQEHVDAGVAAGADGHLMKPVNVADLLGALAPHAPAAKAA